MELHIHREAKTRLPGKLLRELFDLVTSQEGDGRSRATVNLVVTTDQRIRRLNHTYRRKDKATDVLSFLIDGPSVTDGIFGEIYISAQTARRQATEVGRSLIDEYLWLFCHGLLHLFGYDHHRANQAALMREREQYYLGQVSRG